MKDRFGHRHRIFAVELDAQRMALELRGLLGSGGEQLRRYLEDHHPADLADAMQYLSDDEDVTLFERLETDEAAEVLDELDMSTRSRLVKATSDERLAQVIDLLPEDEAADILGIVAADRAKKFLARSEPRARSGELQRLLAYKPDTAGGIMSSGFVAVQESESRETAIERFSAAQDADDIFFVFVVDAKGRLVGTVDLRTLLRAEPGAKMSDLADRHVPTVQPERDQEQVANVFARYDLTALPVVDGENVLLGVITSDDVIDVIQFEAAEDVAHIVGSDATELEKKSPARIAMMRMPWIMATMFIELIAGFVVKEFDGTLSKILLLASFMPIISAISGNTGLQSAAIIIRGLSTGHVQLAHWKHAVMRQLGTTVILGGACGITLGIIGAMWYGKWTFGVLVAVGMFASVNIAGAVGTAIPLVSKKFGFDPALTAGPFETAFQDVVGISIFLGMATLLMPWLK